MCSTNKTTVTFFIINGISTIPELQAPIFCLVLLIYLLTIGGNMTLLLLVCLDRQLHTPMYFFLVNLSALDMTSTTVSLHKTLISFITGDKRVSISGCLVLTYMFGSLLADELLILMTMSYDRYLAICNPLRYHVIMSHRVCALLATFSWVFGFIDILPLFIVFSNLSFTGSNEINHFVCDILPLLNITCSDTSVLETMLFLIVLFHGGLYLFLTFVPYIFIIVAILRIRSNTGRRKAFYTCSSHLTVITLLYITIICQYLKPSSGNNLESDKLFSLFNTAAVPVLNPLIYSLKNKDVKSALRRKLVRYHGKMINQRK